jgi:tRNA dimethylallyltransferase
MSCFCSYIIGYRIFEPFSSFYYVEILFLWFLKISSGGVLSNTLIHSSDRKIIVPVLLGPTAVGKSWYALELARHNGWEIISCDSRQIYRHMDIGTAKPTIEQLNSVKHWLVNIREPRDIYSAFDFANEALSIIQNRAAQGQGVIICGGTGLYFKALSEGFSTKVETDPDLKNKLMELGKKHGVKSLHEELKAVDSDAASTIHENDLQRIVRALAVYHQTGVPFSKSRSKGNAPVGIEFRTIKLTMDRTLLYERINDRVDTMIASGLVDECRRLLESGISTDAPGMQCVGYREWVTFFNGLRVLPEIIEEIKQNSRRYAKRQSTWFSHQVTGLEVETGVSSSVLSQFYTNNST